MQTDPREDFPNKKIREPERESFWKELWRCQVVNIPETKATLPSLFIISMVLDREGGDNRWNKKKS